MAKQGPTTATPSLRFPEFRKAQPWNTRLLKDICTVNPASDGLPDSFVYIDLESVEGGKLKSKNRIGKGGAPSRAQRLLRNGDVIFQVVRPYQRNNLFIDFQDGQAYVASTGYAQLRAKDSEGFLYQTVHVDSFVESVIAKCTGSNYPAINSSDLAHIRLFAPSDTVEQQKIADCLMSLDDVIAAQGCKVEALKAHKRGLMQQLFPREGETSPRLRFPEFRNAPEWDLREVGEVFRVTRGEVLAMPLVKGERLPQAPYPVYSSQTKNRGLAGYFSDFLYEDAITWTTDGANAGEVNYRAGKFYCTNVCGVLLSTEGYANACTAALLNSVSRSYVSYVGNPKLMNGVMAKITIPLPSLAEQQRIADFISFLDTQITAESNRLAALKTHKRGLMQQLFPAPDTATA